MHYIWQQCVITLEHPGAGTGTHLRVAVWLPSVPVVVLPPSVVAVVPSPSLVSVALEVVLSLCRGFCGWVLWLGFSVCGLVIACRWCEALRGAPGKPWQKLCWVHAAKQKSSCGAVANSMQQARMQLVRILTLGR